MLNYAQFEIDRIYNAQEANLIYSVEAGKTIGSVIHVVVI